VQHVLARQRSVEQVVQKAQGLALHLPLRGLRPAIVKHRIVLAPKPGPRGPPSPGGGDALDGLGSFACYQPPAIGAEGQVGGGFRMPFEAALWRGYILARAPLDSPFGQVPDPVPRSEQAPVLAEGDGRNIAVVTPQDSQRFPGLQLPQAHDLALAGRQRTPDRTDRHADYWADMAGAVQLGAAGRVPDAHHRIAHRQTAPVRAE